LSDGLLILRLAHVIARLGLAMTGAVGASLLALYAFVFDETSDASGNLLFGATWMLGVCMQIGAGLAGRLRTARVKDRR